MDDQLIAVVEDTGIRNCFAAFGATVLAILSDKGQCLASVHTDFDLKRIILHVMQFHGSHTTLVSDQILNIE